MKKSECQLKGWRMVFDFPSAKICFLFISSIAHPSLYIRSTDYRMNGPITDLLPNFAYTK